MPPSAEQTEAAYHDYFAALVTLFKRPIIIQTTISARRTRWRPALNPTRLFRH
jgi:hypothetical protein